MRGSPPIPSEEECCPCIIGDAPGDGFVVLVADLGGALSETKIALGVNCPIHGGFAAKWAASETLHISIGEDHAAG